MRRLAGAIVPAFLALAAAARAESIVFPAASGVVDVTNPPYGAKGEAPGRCNGSALSLFVGPRYFHHGMNRRGRREHRERPGLGRLETRHGANSCSSGGGRVI